LLQVLVGCSNDANVHALWAVAAEALEFLFLKNAQELGLKLEGQIADFIKEERATVGELEAADFLVDGAGEGADWPREPTPASPIPVKICSYMCSRCRR
jgi:hypothetical protein